MAMHLSNEHDILHQFALAFLSLGLPAGCASNPLSGEFPRPRFFPLTPPLLLALAPSRLKEAFLCLKVFPLDFMSQKTPASPDSPVTTAASNWSNMD
jgi:hypothetical protein